MRASEHEQELQTHGREIWYALPLLAAGCFFLFAFVDIAEIWSGPLFRWPNTPLSYGFAALSLVFFFFTLIAYKKIEHASAISTFGLALFLAFAIPSSLYIARNFVVVAFLENPLLNWMISG